ncbi:ATP-binding protein [Streptomyces sp. NPDC006134]|uniref:ATP-binding protein n=1 Tax=Streptomyces sp. NPDC006134 TaxID=3154467 RepID=UPI0033C3E810
MDELKLMGSPAGRAPAAGGPPQFSVTFERETLRVADARHWAVQHLAGSHDGRRRPLPPRAVEAAQLVVSELVTNAIKYGSGPVELSLAVADDCLSVTVRDGDTTLPTPRPTDPSRVGQHGLEIVAALSRKIDIAREPSGKRVTAHIALHASAP